MNDESPAMKLVHVLRAVTVEFDLLGSEFAARHGLHPTDVRALIHLLDAARDDIAATPGWLGRRMRLNSAGTTALVDRLERLELVRRTKDTVDRRRVLLKVEDKAMELGWSFFGPLIAEVVAVAEDFDTSEVETVRRFLTAVLTSARQTRTA
ncbi:MarR family winged helix-turn-helix transcriptional regulator [Streptomyces pilosus]|uniref:Transcriptional regulator n=1 Tax=Streptomyces pilosus TaxID=28893 RepID=A0A918BIA6_9ACTN|nr:MarR family transcriptional regulator [Streptomyces pilosus]GGQ70523.1 transcriptional regulator [Streptomyces pilosus]GGV55267.1 transcriptional regulator [Streptomyces pilosus]